MDKKVCTPGDLWTGLALILVLFFFSACQVRTNLIPTPITNQNLVGTIAAATLTAFPPPTPAWTTTPSQQTYSNPDYGFAFDYPPGWQLTETIVQPGTTLSDRSMGRYSVGGGDSPVFLIDLAKGSDWILEVEATKPPTGTCPGGIGPLANDPIYQPMQIFGRNAARLRIEDGHAWNPPEQRELSTLPVMFYKLPGECAAEWPDSSLKAGDVVFLWGYSDPQRPLSISMIYYSNQFTAANLQNRTLDYAVIHEMDQIVQSLRWLSGK